MGDVDPYAGQSQQSDIAVPATTAYRAIWEESCWVMPPLAQIFQYDSQAEAQTPVLVPAPSGFIPKTIVEEPDLIEPPKELWIQPDHVEAPREGPPAVRSAPEQVIIQATGVMPPYAQIFGFDSQAEARKPAYVPPPIYTTDIFAAEQKWPL